MTPEQVARFWAKVDKSGGPDACWPWTAGRSSFGYGKFWDGQDNLGAHRLAWTLSNGQPAPPHLFVCHSCDVPACCNPAHLFLGTNADNIADRHAKGRSACGEQAARAKLSAEAVRNIKASLAAGATNASLAREHKVCEGTIWHIHRNHTWKHINP